MSQKELMIAENGTPAEALVAAVGLEVVRGAALANQTDSDTQVLGHLLKTADDYRASHATRFAFPEPAPLRRAAVIKYQLGATEFEILCTACTVRTASWPPTREEVTWLHCQAMRTAEINPEGPTGLMTVLIPAHYVTGIQPGPTFRLTQPHRSTDLGVFPPNQATPANHLALDEIAAALADLWDPGPLSKIGGDL